MEGNEVVMGFGAAGQGELGVLREGWGVTKQPGKVVGFLLLNGLVVERLEEDVQHQEVLPVGTPWGRSPPTLPPASPSSHPPRPRVLPAPL